MKSQEKEAEAISMVLAAEIPPMSPDECVEQSRLAERIEGVLATLKEQEADIIRSRFGLGCEPQTLERVGRKYGVQRERIRQIEAKALRKIRNPQRGKILKSHWLDENPLWNRRKPEDVPMELPRAVEIARKKYIEPMISAACLGCGECCRKAQCYEGQIIKPGNPCPLLREDRRVGAFLSVYRCQLMEGRNSELFKKLLGAGAGCCSPLFNTTRTALERQLFEQLDWQS